MKVVISFQLAEEEVRGFIAKSPSPTASGHPRTDPRLQWRLSARLFIFATLCLGVFRSISGYIPGTCSRSAKRFA